MKCRGCGFEHGTLRCEVAARMRANGETPLDQPIISVAPKGVGVDRPERRPEIRKVEEFIKKVRGRPRVYPDRKTQMRELMRRKRAKARID